MRKLLLPIPGGGHLEVEGSPDSRRWILFLCRDNFRRDDPVFARVVSHFGGFGFAVARYVNRAEETARIINPGWLPSHPRALHLALKGALLLLHPSRWEHFQPSRRLGIDTIEHRSKALRALAHLIGLDREIHVITRSAGGRVASLVADDAGFRSLVCLSYPFQNPAEGPNPARTAHLPTLRTPFLIFQGTRDPYGGVESAGRYPLAPATTLEWVETDHDFVLPEAGWNPVLRRIADFFAEHSTPPPSSAPTR